jgi:cellulose synthase/poly-beta-1,6-N-acetylglucosamine synthase-like glycosyltransferase
MWLSIGVVFYAYAGYAFLIYALAKFFGRKPQYDPNYQPMVTTLIAAHNEEDCIEAKILNCLDQSYPADRHEIVVVSDGSSDNTPKIVEKYADRNVVSLYEPARNGKTAAVNRAMQYVKGEIVVLSDANNMYNREAVANLTRHFVDPKVGCVSGEKRVLKSGEAPTSGGEGLYWKYESFLKRCDSTFYSVVGAAGEIYAVRKNLYNPPPKDSLLDDFIVSMEIAQQGYRVIYEPDAISYETGSASLRDEFKRRSRIFCGGFQSVARLPRLLNPLRGKLWFQYLSHRVLRWVVTPFLVPLIFVLNALAARRSPLYRLLFAGQILFYLAGLVGLRQLDRSEKRPPLPLYVPAYFIFIHVAQLAGFKRWVARRETGVWARAQRAGVTSPNIGVSANGSANTTITEKIV